MREFARVRALRHFSHYKQPHGTYFKKKKDDRGGPFSSEKKFNVFNGLYIRIKIQPDFRSYITSFSIFLFSIEGPHQKKSLQQEGDKLNIGVGGCF